MMAYMHYSYFTYMSDLPFTFDFQRLMSVFPGHIPSVTLVDLSDKPGVAMLHKKCGCPDVLVQSGRTRVISDWSGICLLNKGSSQHNSNIVRTIYLMYLHNAQ